MLRTVNHSKMGYSVATEGAINFSSTAAGRYALAAYEIAEQRDVIQFAVPAFENLGKLIKDSADFRRLIESPLIEARQAARAAVAILRMQGFGPLLQNTVGALATNRRLRLLPDVVKAFAAIHAAKLGIKPVEVTSAQPLGDTEREALRAKLAEAGYDAIALAEHVDPSILGGLIIKIGSRLYDTSLKSRLQRLQHAMKGAA